MKRLSLCLGALLAVSLPALAADDPVAVRKAIMQSVAANAAVAGGVLKGEIDYVPAIGKATIETFVAASLAYGDYFPESSQGAEGSTAAAAVWTDRAGFEAELDKLRQAAAAAKAASGKDGPASQEAFAAAVQPVLGTCRACHESYRVQN